MKKSLKAFMNGIIDYAGLFPPADLSLDEAIQNYAGYLQHDNAWMLSRFIIPAARLEELEPYDGDLFSKEQPFHFSVLGKETETIGDFHQEIEHVIALCKDFCEHHPGQGTTMVLEIKLPKEAAFSHDTDELVAVMKDTANQLNQSENAPSAIFYEGFFEESWKKDIESIIGAISLQEKQKPAKTNVMSAFKLRCGGTEPGHFPSVEQVAFVLQKTRDHSVALKGTAGLHHPVRHYAESVQAKMHGFFNVFGGAMLGYAHDLSIDELENIISEEDAEQFSFTDEAFAWKEFSIPTSEIMDLRNVALLSFGSCSFDEPRDDLKKLNLF